MKRPPSTDPLSRRERQIMDIVYAAAGGVTAREIQERLPDPPTDATIRTILRVLERKGHLRHREEGKAFVYEATRPAEREARSAVRRLLDVFFEGSVERAFSGLLDATEKPLTPDELKRLEELVRNAREGRE